MDITSFILGRKNGRKGVDPYYQSLSEALMLRDASYISDDPTVMKLPSYTASDGNTLASLNPYSFAGFTEVEAMKFTDVWWVCQNAFHGNGTLKILDIKAPDLFRALTFEANALTGCDNLEAIIVRCDKSLSGVGFQSGGNGDGHGSKSTFYVYVEASDYDRVVSGLDESSVVPASRYRKLEDYPVIDKWGQSFTINFYNGDTLLKTQTVKVGEMPSCDEPTKDGWRFDGWEPELAVATANVDYQAKWDDSIASGDVSDTVQWKLKATGELIISGTGDMPTLSYSEYPWFSYNAQITSVRIEEGITSISDKAFMNPGDYDYQNFTSITMADSVVSIGNSSFQRATKLTNVVLSSNLKSIGNRAFNQCESLESITLPDSLESFAEYAFWRCYKLKHIVIPSGVTDLPQYVFGECSVLDTAYIPATVKHIANHALYSTSLTSVTFEDGSGWYYSTDSTATSGTNVDFTNPETAAFYLKNYTYRKNHYFDAT